jgi:hypothetical protein
LRRREHRSFLSTSAAIRERQIAASRDHHFVNAPKTAFHYPVQGGSG